MDTAPMIITGRASGRLRDNGKLRGFFVVCGTWKMFLGLIPSITRYLWRAQSASS